MLDFQENIGSGQFVTQSISEYRISAHDESIDCQYIHHHFVLNILDLVCTNQFITSINCSHESAIKPIREKLVSIIFK